MKTTSAAALMLTAGLGLGGCALISQLLDIVGLDVLGTMPKAGFSQSASPEFGEVVFALGSQDSKGLGIAPPLDLLTFEDEDGDPIDVEEGEEVPGSEAGTFVLLVDGSTSMLDSDPGRHRVEAAQEVALALAECSDHWDQALMEFTTEAEDGKYVYSRTLAPFGTAPTELGEKAGDLSANGGTPIWDATGELLSALTEHADDHEAELESLADGEVPDEASDSGLVPDVPVYDQYGRSLVVISDGADTASRASLMDVIEQANRAGIAVHAIGLGPASDAETEMPVDSQAIEDLRELALKTGGTYGYVSSAQELPAQADAIAKAICGGYTEMTVRFSDPKPRGERVNGRVSLLQTGIGVPFTFTAP